MAPMNKWRYAKPFRFDVIGEHDRCVKGDQMQTVKVKKEELLEKVKENRANHRLVFEQALVVYKKKVIEELEDYLTKAKAGERVPRMSQLTQPMDQTREYDQAIAMLEMSVDDEIEITSDEFRCFVLDRWHWKGQFATSNRRYVEEYNRLLPLPEESEQLSSEPTNYGRALDVE